MNNNDDLKIKIAKEIKLNFKFLLVSFLIALISIPIISWKQIEVYNLEKDYEAVKSNVGSQEYLKVTSEIENRFNFFIAQSNGCVHVEQVEPYKLNGQWFTGKTIWNYECVFSKEGSVFDDKRIKLYFNVFLCTFLILAICRYIVKATKWVNHYSKKEI